MLRSGLIKWGHYLGLLAIGWLMCAWPAGGFAGEIPRLTLPQSDPLMTPERVNLRRDYQSAVSLIRRGDVTQGCRRLEDLEPRYPMMAGPIQMELASAYLRQGDAASTLRWANALLAGESDMVGTVIDPLLDEEAREESTQTDALVAWGLFLRGEALALSRDDEGAIQALKEASDVNGRGGPSDARIHELTAQCYERLGQPELAYRQYLLSTRAGPSTLSGKASLERADFLEPSLSADARSFRTLLDTEIIDRLIEQGREREALERIEMAMTTCSMPDATANLEVARSRCLARLAQPDEAVQALDALVQSRQLSGPGYWAAVKDLQRLLGKQKDNDTRMVVLRHYLETFPTEVEAIEARMILASILRDRNQWAEAEQLYREVVQLYPDKPETDDARWLLAWSRLRQGDLPEAGAILAEHVRLVTPDTTAESRALYWLGRVQRERGQNLAAWWTWIEVVRRFPNTYYGVMAEWQLKGAVSPAVVAPPDTLTWVAGSIPTETLADGGTLMPGETHWALGRGMLFPGFEDVVAGVKSPPVARQLRRAMEYALMGQVNDALTELSSAVAHPSRDAAASLVTSALYHSVGQIYRGLRYGHLHLTLASLPGIHGPRERRWSLAYPWPYVEDYVREGYRVGVQPALLAALSQQESTFQREVRSPVGATGLMQLMPATARQVARELGLKKPRVRDLYQPELNMRLGAAYLRMQLDNLQGSVPLALAAYNAGPGAVASWKRRLGNIPDDVMAEEIPYKETRQYVQVVLRNYAGYLALYPSLVLKPLEQTGRLQRIRTPGGGSDRLVSTSLDEPGSFIGPGGALHEYGAVAISSEDLLEDEDEKVRPAPSPAKPAGGGARKVTRVQPAVKPGGDEEDSAPGAYMGPGGEFRGRGASR